MTYYDDPKNYELLDGGIEGNAACDNKKSFEFQQGEYLTSFALTTNG